MLWILLCSMLWGLVYTLDEHIVKNHNVFVLYFFQSLFGLFFSSILYLMSNRQDISNVEFYDNTNIYFYGSVVLTSVANLMLLLSIKETNAIVSSSLEISYPLFVVFFSFMFFQKKIFVSDLIGFAFIFIGSTFILMSRKQ